MHRALSELINSPGSKFTLLLQVSAPGDFVADLPATGQVTVGSGVQAAEASLLSSKAGLVRCTRAGKVWIDTKQKRYERGAGQRRSHCPTRSRTCRRYVPAVEESVIGIITERYGDAWNLDINGPYAATLPALAFEGAQLWPIITTGARDQH